MIITKEVTTKWNPTTRKYYEDLGYCYSGHNTNLIVATTDLHKGSNQTVEFNCDECNEQSSTRYSRYIKNQQKYNKDMCNKCICGIISTQKRKDNSSDNYGYCDTYEKRKIELQKYLEQYKTLDNMSSKEYGKKLYQNFKRYNNCVYETAMELGYDIEEISSCIPKNFYDKHPEILKEKLLYFITENNRFPTNKEMERVLKINCHYISKNGGIQEFKKLINYNDSKDLVDLRGDYNKSLGEFIVANYLCTQGLADKYLREQYPFPNENRYFRSDFSFYLPDKEIHVEIWGFKNGENVDDRSKDYQENRRQKELLYDKHSNKVTLISIEYDIFSKKYDEIQSNLYNIFNVYFDLPFKDVSYVNLILPSLMTDEELFNEVMKISPDGITFPTTQELSTHSAGTYFQILKRGYSYTEFANKFGSKLKLDKTEWSKELIFDYFKIIAEQGRCIDKQSMNEQHSNLSSTTEKYGYATRLKLEFFMKLKYIPSQELEWTINLANNTTKTTSNYTNKEVSLAKEILDKFYPNINENVCCTDCGKEMVKLHIYENFCPDCTEKLMNGKRKYFKPLYNEIQYKHNFYKLATEPHLLTSKGFNSISEIKIQSYRNYFGLTWVEVIEKYGKLQVLYEYVINEYIQYIKDTGLQNINTFASKHKYITYDLVDNLGIDRIYSDCNLVKLRYSDNDYRDNFINVVNDLGYIPLYKEFVENTKINIVSYTNKFNLHKNVYDKIIEMYSSKEEYDDYLLRKKTHKSKIGKQTGKLSAIFSDEYLSEHFKSVFENYYSENGKYPSRREFENHSKHDSSVYRRRYNSSWTEICNMYGYNTQQQNSQQPA